MRLSWPTVSVLYDIWLWMMNWFFGPTYCSVKGEARVEILKNKLVFQKNRACSLSLRICWAIDGIIWCCIWASDIFSLANAIGQVQNKKQYTEDASLFLTLPYRMSNVTGIFGGYPLKGSQVSYPSFSLNWVVSRSECRSMKILHHLLSINKLNMHHARPCRQLLIVLLQKKIRRPQCNAFYHISAYKSTYGQDAILVPWT